MNPQYTTKQQFETSNPGRSWEDYKSQYPDFQFEDNLKFDFDFIRNQNTNPQSNLFEPNQDPFGFSQTNKTMFDIPIEK